MGGDTRQHNTLAPPVPAPAAAPMCSRPSFLNLPLPVSLPQQLRMPISQPPPNYSIHQQQDAASFNQPSRLRAPPAFQLSRGRAHPYMRPDPATLQRVRTLLTSRYAAAAAAAASITTSASFQPVTTTTTIQPIVIQPLDTNSEDEN